MKPFIKILSLLLCAASLFSLCACGGETEPAATNAPTTAATTAATTVPVTTETHPNSTDTTYSDATDGTAPNGKSRSRTVMPSVG